MPILPQIATWFRSVKPPAAAMSEDERVEELARFFALPDQQQLAQASWLAFLLGLTDQDPRAP